MTTRLQRSISFLLSTRTLTQNLKNKMLVTILFSLLKLYLNIEWY